MSSFSGFVQHSVLVALGGALGAWLRYVVGLAWARSIGAASAAAFPWATLTVNLFGSLAMGLLTGWLAGSGQGSESWRLLLGVGVLGGFTTFSAFSLDVVSLAQRGAIGTAILYGAISVVGSIAGLVAGLSIAKGFA
ncbi:fluoride efflux transporter CrcB [Novosphingobium sp. NPDC080210]|uniref:fluoride efflux transporter CrcB n=1 Tax=Novosphingobium sp. NPDC080210 TaxID=3390596 RepID=UPI003D08B96A